MPYHSTVFRCLFPSLITIVEELAYTRAIARIIRTNFIALPLLIVFATLIGGQDCPVEHEVGVTHFKDVIEPQVVSLGDTR